MILMVTALKLLFFLDANSNKYIPINIIYLIQEIVKKPFLYLVRLEGAAQHK